MTRPALTAGEQIAMLKNALRLMVRNPEAQRPFAVAVLARVDDACAFCASTGLIGDDIPCGCAAGDEAA